MSSETENGILSRPSAARLALGLLFIAALALLSVGIWEHTGVTGKDEYFLGLRTPLCMMEQDRWLVPCLDGQPRLKKPPMVYWLARASYELFGPSLSSGRLVAAGLGALLVLAIALVALELDGRPARALLAGSIALSFLSLQVGARMLELDVPVAAFSTLAFYFLLRWFRRREAIAIGVAALLLAAGFLTKGPVALVVCGGGALALLAGEPAARAHLARHWGQALAAGLLLLLLALPWFLYVYQLYPEYSGRVLAGELAARRFPDLSLVPLYGVLMLALPWSFAALIRLVPASDATTAQGARSPTLVLWLALTLLPFFFIKTFERYLYGSLVPVALILALSDRARGAAFRWAARLGLALTLALTLALFAAALWISGPSPALALGLPPLAWFVLQWWHATRLGLMALSAAVLWACTLGLVYPRLGINQIPPAVLELARDRTLVLYEGPQPALLPAVLGRSLVHLDGRWQLPAELVAPCSRFLLFVPEELGEEARRGLRQRGFRVRERLRFGILSARVNWQNMARKGLSCEQLLEAVARRDFAAIKPWVLALEVENGRCPGG